MKDRIIQKVTLDRYELEALEKENAELNNILKNELEEYLKENLKEKKEELDKKIDSMRLINEEGYAIDGFHKDRETKVNNKIYRRLIDLTKSFLFGLVLGLAAGYIFNLIIK